MSALVILAVALVVLGIPIWAIVDASRRPAREFERIGSKKTRWLLLLILLSVLVNVAGVIVSIIYLATVRPELRGLAPEPSQDEHLEPRDPELLVSDADREQALQRLHDNFETGRLTLEELNRRVEAVLRAETLGALEVPLQGLPKP
jgi:heme A synthase